MIIQTKDYNGNDIQINYTAEKIEPVELKPELVIDNYSAFRMCIHKAAEQNEYIPKDRDMRYQEALGELSLRDPEAYKKYTQKLREERWAQHGIKL